MRPLHLSLPIRLWVWFTFRQMRMHWLRTVAVLIGIGLGAAVFTSVRLAVNASLDSFTRSVDAITGRSDLTVAYPGGRVPEGLVTQLLKHPAVRTASPVLATYVRPEDERIEPFLLVGIDPLLDRPLRTSRPSGSDASVSASAWVDLIGRPFTMLVGRALSERYGIPGLGTGEDLPVRHVSQRGTFHVLGILPSEGLGLAESGQVAVTDISTMQEFMGLRGWVDRIDILLRPGATETDVEGIAALLPKGAILAKPGEARESGKLMIRSYQLNLSVLSFVSLFVGMFLVYSMMSLHAASRRHELAILRSIGGSSRLVFFLFLAEGAFFGVVGWLAAIPLGALAVQQMLVRVSSTITHLFARVQVDGLTLDVPELAVSFAITVSISLLAAIQPAREAMSASPREVLLAAESPTNGRTAVRLALFGLLPIALAYPLAELPPVGGVPLWGYTATFFLFCGFSLLSPLCLRFAGSHLPPLLRRFFGYPAYLGGRTMRDAGMRVAIPVGALITAFALFVSLTIMVHSFRKTVETWVRQSLNGDLFVRPKTSDINHYRDPLPGEVVRTLRQMESFIEILPYRRIYLHYEKIPYQFEAIDFDAFMKHARFLFLSGDARSVHAKLVNGEGVLVSEVFADQTGISLGKRFRAQIEGVELDLPVLGVVRDYRTQGGVVEYSLPKFQQVSGDHSWSGARVFAMDGGLDSGDAGIRLRDELLLRIGEGQDAIEAIPGQELRNNILRVFDETFAITTVLLFIALFIAALGIATTLTVLVMDRTRELHTLLAVGAGRGQIRAMICWEALLMVLVGECLGSGCGFLLSRLLIFTINRQSFGWTFIYSVDWISLVAALPPILLTTILAALPASQVIFRHPPTTALKDL